MADEYIRKQDAVDAIGEEYTPRTDFERGMVSQMSCDKAKIKALLSADVVQVVRCRDCKYVRKYRSEESAKKFGQVYECVRYTIPCPNPDDFCSYGERKEE